MSTPLHGYIFVTNTLELLLFRMKLMEIIDANAVCVFVLYKSVPTDVSLLLMASWIKYKTLNAVGILITDDEQHQLGTSDKILNPTIYVSFYDPFVIKFGARGFVFGFYVDQYNSSNVVMDMKHNMKQRLANVHKYPLRICIFEYDGITNSVKSPNGTILYYTNLDGELIRSILQKYNFKPEYFYPKFSNGYGYRLPNDTVIGAFGVMERGEADIAANIRPILDANAGGSTKFLSPIDDIEFWFATPMVEKTNDFPLSIYFCVFDVNASIILAVAYFVVVLVWCYMQKLFYTYINHAVNSKYYSVEHTIFTLFGTIVMAAQNVNFQKGFERCIYIFLVFFAIILSTVYQGTMVKLLQITDIDLNINSLEDLALSDLSIATILPFKNVLNTSSDDTVFQKLFKRQQIVSPHELLYKVAVEKKTAALLPQNMAYLLQNAASSTKTGKTSVHLLKHGPSKRFRAHMVQNRSPYSETFNEFFRSLNEMGLPNYWLKKQFDELSMKIKIRDSKLEIVESKLFGMNTLGKVFQLYCVMCFLCICVLLGEMLTKKFMQALYKKFKNYITQYKQNRFTLRLLLYHLKR